MRVRRETRRRPSEIYTDYGLDSPAGCYFRDAISMTKRYFTSLFSKAFVGFVDLLHPDQFDIRGNAVIGAEIQHFLGLPNPPDPGTGQLVPVQKSDRTTRRATASAVLLPASAFRLASTGQCMRSDRARPRPCPG